MTEKAQEKAQDSAAKPRKAVQQDTKLDFPAMVKLVNDAAVAHTLGGVHVLPYSESEAFPLASSDEMRRLTTDIAALAKLYPHYANEDGGLLRIVAVKD